MTKRGFYLNMRCILKVILLQYCCLLTVLGQEFNSTFVFDHKQVVFSSVKEMGDSTYIIAGQYLNQAEDRIGTLYIKLDQQGNLIDSLQVAQQGSSYFLGSTRNELFFNHKGNFVVTFSHAKSGVLSRQHIQEITPNLELVSDVVLDTLAEYLNLTVFSGSMIIQNELDSTYLMFFTAVDTSVSTAVNRNGCNLVHLDKDFRIIHNKRFFLNHNYGLSMREIIQYADDEFLVMMRRFNGHNTQPNHNSFTQICRVNANGDHIWPFGVWESTDNQMDINQRALTITQDGGLLYTYHKGYWLPPGSGNTWRYVPTLRKLDSNRQIEWSIELTDSIGGYYSIFSDIEAINDTLFVTAGGTYRVNGELGQSGGRLIQFTLDGQVLWERDFFHFSRINPNFQYIPSHFINDLALTSDGGFILVGGTIHYELEQTGEPTDYGWVVKLNCLGFLGPPEAGVHYIVENDYLVNFVNTSVQADCYTWDFGDGTVIETTDAQDTLTHHYSGFGNYPVQLIAHGCNGEADTLVFYVSPQLHANPQTVTEGEGYFTFFPNPVVSGNPLYVYLKGVATQGKEVQLRFYNNSGQHVTDYPIASSQGTYMIHPTLASGVYHVSLMVGNEVLQSRKLVVD